MMVKDFFDKATCTMSYVIYDAATKDAVIVDPVLDFDPASGVAHDESALKIVHFLQNMELKPRMVLETHVHADHMSSSQTIKRYYPDVEVAISSRVTKVQSMFREILDLKGLKTDGSQFDRLIGDNERGKAGSLEFLAIPTPGHTPACTSYLFEDALFVGDSIFMPDSGTGRCDFPGGDADTLFASITKGIYLLPEETRIFVGHDYQPGGRALIFETSVGQQRAENIHIKADTKQENFVKFRRERDQTLSAPRLLYPSLQVNLEAGRLPAPDKQGRAFLKMPFIYKPAETV